jgi:hypothetical protein
MLETSSSHLDFRLSLALRESGDSFASELEEVEEVGMGKRRLNDMMGHEGRAVLSRLMRLDRVY